MRVLFDMTFPARNRSGIGVYGRELLAALRLAAPPGWQLETFTAPGSAHRPDLARKLADAAGWLYGVECMLPARIWQVRPAVLHAPAFIAPLAPLPCPLVVTVHDTILEDGRQPFHPAWRAFHRVHVSAALRRAAAVIVPTANTAADVARVYGVPGARVHVVPYGVSAAFRPLPPEAVQPVLARHGLARPYVLFVGAQVARKDAGTLLAALAQIDGPDLALVGAPGDATASVQAAIARLGLAGRVHQLTGLTTEELVALYNGARAFAYPSLYEGGGLPPLEALACGTPVVAADTGAVRELLGDAALFVPPRDAGALTAALERVLADEPLRASLLVRGPVRARELSWARAAERTLAIYRSVCGNMEFL